MPKSTKTTKLTYDVKPKYYVWNQNNRLPVKKHSTLTDATKEAERLSLKHPKDKFVVVYIVKYIGPSEA